jgi:excisionase family DNA binding protein
MRPTFGRGKDMAMDERRIDFVPQVFTVVEAAARLKVSRALLYEFIRAGDLHLIKLGTRTLILAAESCAAPTELCSDYFSAQLLKTTEA